MMRKNPMPVLVAALTVTVALGACSSGGGKKAEDAPASGDGAAKQTTMTVAMVTHQRPGDTFWDIVRKGAEKAAANDGVKLEYSNDPDATRQAQLVQAAIDKKVDGIAVTDPNDGAIGPMVAKATAAGIPVTMLNAGETDWKSRGAIGYFGQGEKPAGVAVGRRVVENGAKSVLCVIHDQGQQQLEDRCAGVSDGAGAGAKVARVYVTGGDDSSVTTNLQAKLTQDSSIDRIVTLNAKIALDAVKAVKAAGSKAKIGTFDTDKELVAAIKDGSIEWAIDQQPYLQGYLAVEALYLHKSNGNTIGGGGSVATGPAFIDKTNIDKVAAFAANGTR